MSCIFLISLFVIFTSYLNAASVVPPAVAEPTRFLQQALEARDMVWGARGNIFKEIDWPKLVILRAKVEQQSAEKEWCGLHALANVKFIRDSSNIQELVAKTNDSEIVNKLIGDYEGRAITEAEKIVTEMSADVREFLFEYRVKDRYTHRMNFELMVRLVDQEDLFVIDETWLGTPQFIPVKSYLDAKQYVNIIVRTESGGGHWVVARVEKLDRDRLGILFLDSTNKRFTHYFDPAKFASFFMLGIVAPAVEAAGAPYHDHFAQSMSIEEVVNLAKYYLNKYRESIDIDLEADDIHKNASPSQSDYSRLQSSSVIDEINKILTKLRERGVFKSWQPEREPSPVLARPLGSQVPAAAAATWACPVCTYLNKEDHLACEMCGTERPHGPEASNNNKIYDFFKNLFNKGRNLCMSFGLFKQNTV